MLESVQNWLREHIVSPPGIGAAQNAEANSMNIGGCAGSLYQCANVQTLEYKQSNWLDCHIALLLLQQVQEPPVRSSSNIIDRSCTEHRTRMMTDGLFWTIVFGVLATAIGFVTVWQNFIIVEIRRNIGRWSTR